ncbi:MAG TPA: hypothetical protein VHZ98_13915 [Galbitalea sp.]|jgi:uncharacterized protein with LGFP repeats|nr:hypothetical protein [Galbitalea sp.]
MRVGGWRKLLAMALAAAAIAAGLALSPLALSDQAVAQPMGDWDPGYIITDGNFYNGGALTAPQVQTFLNSQVASCTKGYTCLKDYRQPVPSMAADAYCSALTGSSMMTAAQLIVAVSLACNFSPKALIVLLQKEQSLVTATAPSAGAYANATGFSCPDTAPCDPQFSGFFYQVYYAARQFQIYRLRPASFNFRAGGTYGILYNPDASCGRLTVTITNAATAGLYDYTPYTPNSAAMNNLYGEGNGCSSYGNRNFWRIWWDWFGNPGAKSGPEYIADLYAAQGGAAGWLGAASGAPNPEYGGWVQDYAGGSIYWYTTTGAQIVSADMLTKYTAAGGPLGPLGWPYGAGATDATSHGVAGKWQWFQGGTMYWSATTGAHVLHGATKDAFASFGGLGGALGWPTNDETSVSTGGGGVWQSFMSGSVYVRNNGVSAATLGAIDTYYLTQGGPSGTLGWPESNEVAWNANGSDGEYQDFQTGIVYQESDLAAVTVKTGAIRTAYGAAGGSTGPLGWPTAEESCVSGGSCSQTFQGGGAYSTEAYGAYAVSGPVFTYYTAQGGATGSLGWPTGSASCTKAGVCTQEFEAGIVTASPNGSGGAVATLSPHAVTGVIGSLYTSMGGDTGVLGKAKSGLFRSTSTSWQVFTNGEIVVVGSVAIAVVGPMWPEYEDAGGPGGWLGAPIAAQTTWSAGGLDGSYQYFQNGVVYNTTTTGTVAVASGPIRSTYGAAGGSSGPLGWPTADAIATTGGMSQQFQGGSIYQSGSKAFVVAGAIAAKYQSAGGPGGSLGWPSSAETDWSAKGLQGSYQDFQGGVVYSQATLGTVIVQSGPIRTAYSAAGGSPGALGWPTADAVCDGQQCQQTFQGGALYQSGSAVYSMYDPILAKFTSLGGTAGMLGWPTSSAISWTAAGVSGTYTNFENGIVYSSATTGTIVVASGPIRTAYSTAGGSPAYLGWPTADAVCDAQQRCEQVFQGGRIYQTDGAAYPMSGITLTKFQAMGGTAGVLGWPESAAVPWSANKVTGSYTSFDNGLIYASTTTGAVSITSAPIRTAYGAVGGSLGSLGWPTADAVCDGSGNCTQQFQGGEARAIVSGGAVYGVAGPMLQAYATAGGASGPLGLPASTAISAKAADLTNAAGSVTTIGTTGAWQYFASADVIMYWTPNGGAHTIANGAIRTYYGSLGGLAGSTLGFPIGDQTCTGSVCQQVFEHGTIVDDGSGPHLK